MKVPLNTLIALVVITSPVDLELKVPPCSVEVIKSTAVGLEILSPTEAKWFFSSNPHYFQEECEALRRRYKRLKFAPPLVDVQRFPSMELCQQMKEVNRSYHNWLERQLQLNPTQDWIEGALQENRLLYKVWDELYDIQSASTWDIYRIRSLLSDLRDMLGPGAYYGGFMPPAIPVWRLRRID